MSFYLYISQNLTIAPTIYNHKQALYFRFFAFKISDAYKRTLIAAKQNGLSKIQCRLYFTYVPIFF